MSNTGLMKFNGDPLYESDIVETNLQNIYWRTKEGQLIAIKNMNDSHLRNTALMLMGMGYQVYNVSDNIKILWLTALKIEWHRRMMIKELNKAYKGDDFE